jgi:drug/metabolite transporter (DMT)-like permease
MKHRHLKSLKEVLPVAFSVQNIFAFVPIAIKSTSADVLSIAVIRLVMTVFCLSFFKMDFLSHLKKNWYVFLLLGLLFSTHWYTYFTAVKLGTPSLALLGLSSYGLFLNFYAWFFFKEKASAASLIAVVVSIFGVFLIAKGSSAGDDAALIMAILSGSIYAFLPIVHRRFALIPTRVRVQFQFAGALLFFLPFSGDIHLQYTLSDWGYLLYLSIGATLVGHGLWVWVTTHSTAVFASLAYFINIPMVLFWEKQIFGKTLSGDQLVGAAIMVGAQVAPHVWNFTLKRSNKERSKKEDDNIGRQQQGDAK